VSRARLPCSASPSLVLAAVALVVISAFVAGSLLALRPHGSPGGSREAADPKLRASGTSASWHRPPKSPAPVPSPGSSPPPRQQRDPFGSAGAALASTHPGMILAAVYDVDTGQEWNLGHGPAQAEASVVKLDILETLLARYRDVVSTLPADDLAGAQQMMEFSDNTAGTALWFAAGGPGEIGSYNATIGLRHTSLSQCVDCPEFPWPGWGLSTTTPEDQIALLRQLISPRSRLTRRPARNHLRARRQGSAYPRRCAGHQRGGRRCVRADDRHRYGPGVLSQHE